jgi:hypothetical protein
MGYNRVVKYKAYIQIFIDYINLECRGFTDIKKY